MVAWFLREATEPVSTKEPAMKRILSSAVTLILTLAVPGAAEANPDIFEHALRKTAWVLSPVSSQQQSIGTGVVVSVHNRWVLTAYHVTEERQGAFVVFPQADFQGQLITSPA